MKIGVLRNFTKFTGKHLCRSLFFNSVAGLRHCFIVYIGVKYYLILEFNKFHL